MDAAGLRKNPLRCRLIGVFPVHWPMLVARLNAFRPAILPPYATTGALLPSEQQAGHLHSTRYWVALSAEGLAAEEYDRIATYVVLAVAVFVAIAATVSPTALG